MSNDCMLGMAYRIDQSYVLHRSHAHIMVMVIQSTQKPAAIRIQAQ